MTYHMRASHAEHCQSKYRVLRHNIIILYIIVPWHLADGRYTLTNT